MVALRLDPRLTHCINPACVVEEALAEASRKLGDYVQERPLPFYLWLRRLVWERLLKLQRHYWRKRSIAGEAGTVTLNLPGETATGLSQGLSAPRSSASHSEDQEAFLVRIRFALRQVSEPDRELLMLRDLERLSTEEIATILEIHEEEVKMRHLKAVAGLRRMMQTGQETRI